MPWKPEYEENRKKREAENPALRERRLLSAKLSQDRNREFRRGYMADYYKKNPTKFGRRTQEQRDKFNAKRRERYAKDAIWRTAHKESVRVYQTSNPAMRQAQRLRAYGLTVAEFDAMMMHQQNKCAICGHSKKSHKLFPMIDHCHKTWKVRGILCSRCNMGIGNFKDSIDTLQSAIVYLQNNGSSGVTSTPSKTRSKKRSEA